MAENDFIVRLSAALDNAKSKKQVNNDINQLEKTIRSLRLTAILLKGESKQQINQAIGEIENKVKVIKLKANFDTKQAQKAIDSILKNMSINDININEQGFKLKVRKAYNEIKSELSRTPIPVNLEFKKAHLQNQLTSYITKNSKIQDSVSLLNDADNLRGLFDSVNDKESLNYATERFKLFKSETLATGFAAKSTSDKISALVGKVVKIGSLFGVASFGIQKYRESISTIREISTLLTEISKTSNITEYELEALGDSSFATASKYGKNASNYLEGVREMVRSGYDGMAKELGELSVLAQSAGDISTEMANNYILAIDAAYKYSGSIGKLTSAIDGANNISNNNSTSLTDIADAIRVSASFAAQAGVEIDQLTAAEATMIAVTKRSGSEMGRAFRSILMNLQQVSGEFDGEVIDAEQLKKVESRCRSLGVELETLKNGVTTLRNPMEVLKELAKVYNSLPENSADKQGLITDLGGKYNANALTALLSRYDLYSKMLSEFSQGTGSSLTDAMKTADSWEGRLASLQNTFDSFVNSITNQEYIKTGISFLDNTIQGFQRLTDVLCAIPVLMASVNSGLSLMNKDYGITQLFSDGKVNLQGDFMGVNITAIKKQKQHFEEAAKAIEEWNIKLQSGQTDINDFSNTVVKNNVQLRDYLSTCSVQAPASLEAYKTALKAAGVETDTLRLKTAVMTAGMSLLVGFAIQATITGISKLTQIVNDHIHATEGAKETLIEASSNFSNVKSEIEKLSEELKNNKKRIEELQALPTITYLEQEELDKLKEATKELELQEDIKNIELKRSVEELSKANRTAFEKEFGDDNFSNTDVKALDSSYGDLSLSPTSDIALAQEGVEGIAAAIIKVQRAQQEATSNNDSEWLNSLIDKEKYYKEQLEDNLPSLQEYRNTLNNIMNYRELTDEEQAFYDNLEQGMKLIYQYTNPSAWNQIEFQKIFNTDSLGVTKEALIGFAQASKLDESTIKQYSKLNDLLSKSNFILADDETAVDSFINQIIALAREAEEVPQAFKKSPKSLRETITTLGAMSDKFSVINKLYADFKENGTGKFSNEGLQSIIKAFEDVDGVDVDGFLETLSSSKSTAEDVQDAFDNLAEQYIQATGCLEGLTSANAEQVARELESMGVKNAAQLVSQALANEEANLAAQKYYAAYASFDLANATTSEISAFINEAVSAGISRGAILELMMAKLSCNSNGIITNGDIKNLESLANAANIASTAVKNAKDASNTKYNKQHGEGRTAEERNEINTDIYNGLKNAIRTEYKAEIVHLTGGSEINSGRNGNSNAGNPNTGSSNSPAAKEVTESLDKIDLAAQSISILESHLAALESRLKSEELPYEDQLKILDEIIQKQSELVEANSKTVGIYTEEWEKAKKALSQNGGQYIDSITSGKAFSIEEFKGESGKALYEQIKTAQDAYNKMLDAQKDYTDASIELENKRIDKYNKEQNRLDNRLDTLKSGTDKIQDNIDLVETVNGQVSEKTYRNLIRLSAQEEDVYRRKIALAKKALKSESPDSDRYYKLQKEIADCESAISDCKKSQLEWNQSILEIPINHLEKANDELDKQIDKQQKLMDTYDGVISGMLDILDEQKEALQKEQEDSDKYYDGLIENLNKEKDTIQEQIDLLQDKNDEKDRAIETEKKLAALENAKNQKTVKKLINGEWVWDYDYDAINTAQKDYDDQLVDNNINNLQSQQEGIDKNINNLDDKKQEASDAIQEKIDALEEYRKKLEEISSAYEKEQNKQGATNFFGMTEEQLRSKLLNKNLELITKINTSYQDTEARMDELSKTKEKNEELIKTFQDYITAWQNGTISISEAKLCIQEIVSDNGLEIETIDARTMSVGRYRSSWDETEESIGSNLLNINELENISTEEEAAMWLKKLEQAEAFRVVFDGTMQKLNAGFSTSMDSMIEKFTLSANSMEEQARRIVKAISDSLREAPDNDSKSSGSSSKPSSNSDRTDANYGPAFDPKLRSHHAGLESGFAGRSGTVNRKLAEQLLALANNPPATDESIKVVKNNELILTQEQSMDIIRNYSVPNVLVRPSAISDVVQREQASNPNINIGDIYIEHANDVDKLANDIKNRLPQKMLQEVFRK